MKKLMTLLLINFLIFIGIEKVNAKSYIFNGENFVKWLCKEDMDCAYYQENFVKLSKNVNLKYNDNQLAIVYKDLTLDLNGYTIENNSNGLNNDYFINSYADNFIIKDSSEQKNGKIINNTRGIVNVLNGNLYIEGGNFIASRDAAYAFGIAEGKMFLDDGKINSTNVGIHLYGTDSYFFMNGGTINTKYSGIYTSGCLPDNDSCNNGKNSINIYNGNIYSDSSVKAFSDIGNIIVSLNIFGGKFEGSLNIYEPRNNMQISLSGGEFQKKSNSDFSGAINFYSLEKVLNKSDILNTLADGFSINPSSIDNKILTIDDVNYYVVCTNNHVKIIKSNQIESDNSQTIKNNDIVKNPKTIDINIYIIIILIIVLIEIIYFSFRKLNKRNS